VNGSAVVRGAAHFSSTHGTLVPDRRVRIYEGSNIQCRMTLNRNDNINGKGKVNPLQARCGPEGR